MALIQCPICGAMVSDQAPVCPKCGAALTNGAVNPQPQPVYPQAAQPAAPVTPPVAPAPAPAPAPAQPAASNDVPNGWLNVASFFPPVGWILAGVFRSRKPKAARSYNKWGWIGFGVWMAFWLIYIIVIIAILAEY